MLITGHLQKLDHKNLSRTWVANAPIGNELLQLIVMGNSIRLKWVKSGTQFIFFLYLNKNICGGYSVESPPLCASNEHHKMFL